MGPSPCRTPLVRHDTQSTAWAETVGGTSSAVHQAGERRPDAASAAAPATDAPMAAPNNAMAQGSVSTVTLSVEQCLRPTRIHET
jgi:hypothetical protein